MNAPLELLRHGRRREFWQHYCGFLDLNADEFVAIQERLLMEQLRLLADSALARKIIGPEVPQTPAEFRRVAPLTTYRDYVPYLSEQRDEMLPSKPVTWMRTSGRQGEYRGKWVPMSREHFVQLGRSLMIPLILSGAQNKGDVILEEGLTLLYVAAPPPYITGTTMRAFEGEFPARVVPSVAVAEKLGFQERVEQAFRESMGTGIDYFFGIASVLLRIGQAFTHGSRQMSFSPAMLQPTILFRLLGALTAAKLQGRQLLPKDIWRPKGIIASGMDVQVYRKLIQDLWGRSPLEVYACTEFGGMAAQPWGDRRQAMTPWLEPAFWEFLPEREYAAWRADPTYRPQTHLINQLQPGKYILVGTSLLGGAFIRYIIGDIVRIVALRDEERGISLPQMVVESRADDIINLGSMLVLTERSIWEAIGHSELSLVDWILRKEVSAPGGEPLLHMFIECEPCEPARLAETMHQALMETHEEYPSFCQIMARNPLIVSVLTPGTFQRYLEEKQAADADLGQLKPPRMQPNDQITQRLLAISSQLGGRQ